MPEGEERRGADGLTWRERRAFRKWEVLVRNIFFMDCPKHGDQVPIHPFTTAGNLCFYCVEDSE